MVKQTKLIKVMITILILIPVIMCLIGIITTFVLKSKQAKLLSELQTKTQTEEEYNKQSQIYNYKSSEQYLEDLYRHSQEKIYGQNGDVNIEITE